MLMTSITIEKVNSKNSHYLEEIFELTKDRLRLEGTVTEEINNVLNLIENTDHQFIKFDYFIALRERTVISAQTRILRKYHNSWYITGLKIRPGFSYFNCNTNGIKEIMTACVEEAETMGYYSYNFMSQVGQKNLARFRKMQSQIDILHRYNYYTEHYVPANTLPTLQWYSAILRNRTWDFDSVIRSGYLREEYRDAFKIK